MNSAQLDVCLQERMTQASSE